MDNGQIASHGKTFGLSSQVISKLGVDLLPANQASLGAYLNSLGEKYDVLNGTLDTSVQAYVGQAVSNLINGAPTAYDVSSFAELQAQVGQRAQIYNEQGQAVEFSGDLYHYSSYIADFKISLLDVTDSAVSGQYVSQVTETDGKISVTRAALPSKSDT